MRVKLASLLFLLVSINTQKKVSRNTQFQQNPDDVLFFARYMKGCMAQAFSNLLCHSCFLFKAIVVISLSDAFQYIQENEANSGVFTVLPYMAYFVPQPGCFLHEFSCIYTMQKNSGAYNDSYLIGFQPPGSHFSQPCLFPDITMNGLQ